MTSNYESGESGAEPGDIKDKLKEDLGSKAREASRQFADRGKAEAEALSGKAADALDDIEAVAEVEAEELERRGWNDLSSYVRDMASGIGELSDNLRHKSVDELVRSASDLASRNTGLFVLGSIAIGFGLSRFVKAAPTASTGDMRRAYSDSDSAYDDSADDDMAYAGTRYSRSPDFDPADTRYAYPAGENSSNASSDEYRPYESH
ncbi:MAG: hypothetical protein SV422_13000 [Pseudomonadota bacterium]|nr:hypothetical protein [Pseudomonadota bacterium]